MAVDLQDLVRRRVSAIESTQIEVRLGIEAVSRQLQRGPRQRQIGLGRGQIGIGGEGLLDQPIQLGIVIRAAITMRPARASASRRPD